MKKIMLIIVCYLILFSQSFAEDEIIWQKSLEHLGIISNSAISPNENLFAHGLEKYIHVRDMEGRAITTLDGHDEIVTALSFSKDGKFLFSGAGNPGNLNYVPFIIKWNIDDYQIESVYEPSDIENYFLVESIDISPNSLLIAGLFKAKTQTGGNYNHKLFIWNSETSEIIYEVDFPGTQPVTKIKFASDSHLYFISGNHLAMLSIPEFTIDENFGNTTDWHSIEIADFDISNDQKIASTVDLSGICKIWNLSEKTLVSSFFPIKNGSEINKVLFGKEDKFLIFANKSDKSMYVFNIPNMELYSQFDKSNSLLNSVILTANKDKALLNSAENLYFINLTYEKIIEVKEHSTKTIECTISPNPFTDKFIINLNGSNTNILDYTIINIFGQSVQSNNAILFNNNCEINLNDIKAGIYFIIINLENSRIIKKVIKLYH